MSNRLPGRSRNELIQMLFEGWRAFFRLPYSEQRRINAIRFVPVEETMGLLEYYLRYGRFYDEPPYMTVRHIRRGAA
jgi:hypothetical protein